MTVEYIDLLINKQEQVTIIWIDKVLLNTESFLSFWYIPLGYH